MLNTQLNNGNINTNVAPILGGLSTGIVEGSLGADSTFDKYSFIEIVDGIEIKTITLADFLTDGQKGIYVIDSDVRDIAEKEFQQFNNPFSDGGQILGEKYTQKEFELELGIITDGIVSLEATISNLKSIFDSGGKLQFNHNGTLRTIDVKIDTFKVDTILGYRADITVTFLSVAPFFESETKIKTITGLAGDQQTGLGLFETERNIYADIQLILTGITGSITGASISYNGYTVTYTGTLSSGDVVEFNGKTKKVILNGSEVPKYSGQFTEFKKNKQTAIDIAFTGAGSVDNYNAYILHNNIFL